MNAIYQSQAPSPVPRPWREWLSHIRPYWWMRSSWSQWFLCWALGVAVIALDSGQSHDLRFRLRGSVQASADPRIALIEVREQDLSIGRFSHRNFLRSLKEFVTLSDAIFWEPELWTRLLERVLAADPATVAVTFAFGPVVSSSGELRLSDRSLSVFNDPRILWAVGTDEVGKQTSPQFLLNPSKQVATRTLRPDDDGIVRRVPTTDEGAPSLAERAVQVTLRSPEGLRAQGDASSPRPQERVINWKVASGGFPVYTASDVLSGAVPLQKFRGTVILIGHRHVPESMLTPLGLLPRLEIHANAINMGLLGDRVFHTPFGINLFFIALVVLFGHIAVRSYPPPLAFTVVLLFGIFWMGVSALLFDTSGLWVPVVGPLMSLGMSSIVTVGRLLTLQEQRSWQLEQENSNRSELSRLKSNFVSMMSHDLKTPLARIEGICDRIESRAIGPETQTDIQGIRAASGELNRYIGSLLRVSRLETSDFVVNPKAVDLNQLIDRAVASVSLLCQRKQQTLTAELEPMFSIEADETLLFEVLVNLLENAMKYTPTHGTIRIESREGESTATVVVIDSGPGIPIEEQELVWQKFGRGQSAAMTSAGSGLGLYLVRYFVELHGGEVFLESGAGQGTRIGFNIPLAKAGAP